MNIKKINDVSFWVFLVSSILTGFRIPRQSQFFYLNKYVVNSFAIITVVFFTIWICSLIYLSIIYFRDGYKNKKTEL